ncbi:MULTISPECIES: SRPBCC family protein [Polaromonas]|uniref:SRPBCC family protein n=1 Tax=Polaromonas aquatica TaxID=332657 RepID=A0ABW1TQ32_9BURK
MTTPSPAAPASDRELVLTRLIDAPREKVFKAWTTPELLVQWFTPKPWQTVRAEVDVRPGGASLVVMRGPDGTEFPNRGVYLEVVPNKRLVFTDAFTEAWKPSEKPFMTGVLTFEDEGGKTRYTARVLHWTVADREAHEKMGFHEGWGKATDQLAELIGAPRPTA